MSLENNLAEEKSSTDLEQEVRPETVTLAQISRQEHEVALAASRAREARLERQLAQFRAMRQDDLLASAISDWAVDADTVLGMLRSAVAMDEDGALYPVDANGAPLQEDGKAIDLTAFFQRFRREKPYLVKASSIRGAGSITEGSGASLPNSIDSLAELPMAQFIQAGGLK